MNRELAVKQPCPGLQFQRTEKGWAVIRWHYSSDPDMTEDRLATLRGEFSSDALWTQELEIDPWALSGQRIYPEFSEADHVIADELIPPRLCRYMALDPHPRTPHAFLWLGIDQWDDWYIYREFWPSPQYGKGMSVKDTDIVKIYTVKEYAETIALMEGNQLEFRDENGRRERARYKFKDGERIVKRFADQAGKGFIASGENEAEESYAARYARYGIHCHDPYKMHRAGQDAIHSLLKPRLHETRGWWPKLHVARSCVETIYEFKHHRFQTTKNFNDERELKQKEVEARSHMLDNARYLACANIGYVKGFES